jgi:hypothetical protein
VSDLLSRSRAWIEAWLSRIAQSVGVERRPSLSIEAATYLDSLTDRAAGPVLRALDDIVEDPSHGHPSRHRAERGPFAGEVVDLSVADHRIVYSYGPLTIRVRLIERLSQRDRSTSHRIGTEND